MVFTRNFEPSFHAKGNHQRSHLKREAPETEPNQTPDGKLPNELPNIPSEQLSRLGAGPQHALWFSPEISEHSQNRPEITVILATSADGKIADANRSPAQFSSQRDRAHLETQIARSDVVLFGVGTLRAHQSTLPVRSPHLLKARQERGQPPQPIHVVASRSGNIDPNWRFFRQPVPRWLLTTERGARPWQGQTDRFHRIAIAETAAGEIDWQQAMSMFGQAGGRQLAAIGGGELVAALLEEDLVDAIWLTVCPLLLGGTSAPTPVGGSGFSEAQAKRLHLTSVEAIAGEVFLHYRLHRNGSLH